MNNRYNLFKNQAPRENSLALVCKDLGLTGKAIPKVINSRQYIILSGYAGFRNHLPDAIYSTNNRKIIQMAIGELGLKKGSETASTEQKKAPTIIPEA